MTKNEPFPAHLEFSKEYGQRRQTVTEMVISISNAGRLVSEFKHLQQAASYMAEALGFYKKIDNYMADLIPYQEGDKTARGFDFKHTLVHNDGGEIARQALAEWQGNHEPKPTTNNE